MRRERFNEVDTPTDMNSASTSEPDLPPEPDTATDLVTDTEPVVPNPSVCQGSPALRTLKRAVVLVTGMVVLLVGIAMLVLPGPAVIVIPAGLAILATEFLWARRILKRMKDFINRTRQRV